jgi:ATP-dependent phosphofructokinase / diphosphate-dependent phosphofructokinase
MKIGVLTGGGDCPGLNATIRAVVRRAKQKNNTVMGILGGWKGLINLSALELDLNSVSGILHKGGTILGTSRTNPFKKKSLATQVARNIQNLGLDGLVVIGGYDTLGVAGKFYKQFKSPIVGIPKTIDRDVPGTFSTIGFDTAVTIATEAIDRLHSTAESHNRLIIVELMGRNAGWIAVDAGIAGGADVILVPEFPMTVQEIANILLKRHNRGKKFSIVVVSEGAKIIEGSKKSGKLITRSGEKDDFGNPKLGGVGMVLSEKLKELVGFDARVSTLGHVQRGGSPTPHDRNLATRMGVAAVDQILAKNFGTFAGVQGGVVTAVKLDKVMGKPHLVDAKTWDMAKTFFG